MFQDISTLSLPLQSMHFLFCLKSPVVLIALDKSTSSMLETLRALTKDM